MLTIRNAVTATRLRKCRHHKTPSNASYKIDQDYVRLLNIILGFLIILVVTLAGIGIWTLIK